MPNERLVEMELATLLNANRAQIRTALARLEQEGLVVIEPNRGARVRRFTDAEAIEITQARAALETFIAREAAEKATSEDHKILRGLREDMREAIRSGDLMAYSRANGKLHGEIQRIAGNATINRILSNLESQIVRFQFRLIMMPGRTTQSLAEHECLVEAVCSGDPEEAEHAMRDHLTSVVANLKACIALAGETVLASSPG